MDEPTTTTNSTDPTPADQASPQSMTDENGPSATSREWLAQLQSMIDNVATTAAPMMREIGAKAAELAAMAGEKAGPFAQKAAEVTANAGTKVAERGREVAAELRRDQARSDMGDETRAAMEPPPAATPTAGATSTTDAPAGSVADRPDSLGQ